LYQQVPLADVVVLVEYVGVRHADVADSVALVQVDHPVDIRDDGFTTRLLPRLEDLLDAGQACRDVAALFSRTTRMEGPQRELRARLANRLCGNDTDRRPDVDQIAPAKVAAIAELAQAEGQLARHWRAYQYLGHTRALDRVGSHLVDDLITIDDNLARLRVWHR